MKLITKADMLRGVPKQWNEQYGPRYIGSHYDDIYKKLCVLIGSGTYTEQQVDDIIGNDAWTKLMCDECGLEVEAVAQLGEEPDYESKTLCICLSCLKKIADFFGIEAA